MHRDLNDEQTKIKDKAYWQYLESLDNLEVCIYHIIKSRQNIEDVSRCIVQLVFNYKNSL